MASISHRNSAESLQVFARPLAVSHSHLHRRKPAIRKENNTTRYLRAWIERERARVRESVETLRREYVATVVESPTDLREVEWIRREAANEGQANALAAVDSCTSVFECEGALQHM
jgi:hypothetical protein